MNFEINKNIEEISNQISSVINRELSLGKNVLWFVSGGSAVPVEVMVSNKIKKELSSLLSVTLADERYGLVDHKNSNWLNLKQSGFNVANATIITYLSDNNFFDTEKEVEEKIQKCLSVSGYKIGVFGMGEDGHTAGILPNSESVNSGKLVCAYETPMYRRITITPKTIVTLDEAFLYCFGENKWPALEKLKQIISIEEEPVQVLKQVPLLTIFTDYNK